MGAVVPSKGVNRYGLTELKRFIYETGRTQAILQCDAENSIKANVRAVLKELGGLTFRVAPVGSSQSQGSVERWHRHLFSQVRVLRLALAKHLQIEIKDIQVHHPIVPWIVKHASWLLNRYLVHDDGLTSYQRRFKQQALPGLA